jgi:hypothetical protein
MTRVRGPWEATPAGQAMSLTLARVLCSLRTPTDWVNASGLTRTVRPLSS